MDPYSLLEDILYMHGAALSISHKFFSFPMARGTEISNLIPCYDATLYSVIWLLNCLFVDAISELWKVSTLSRIP